MKDRIVLKVFEDECWYSGCIDDTVNMPYTSKSNVSFNAIRSASYNEVNPLLLSTKGRYIYAPNYFSYSFENGTLTIESPNKMDIGEKATFKDAYLFLKDKYFEFDGRHPNKILFEKPQYCTWMALGENVNQEGVMKFAKEILSLGMPPGEIIIDDGWCNYHGEFNFSKEKFPDPYKMCKELKEMGFLVSVWVVPYVSSDSKNYRYLKSKDFLLKDENGKPCILEWWDGFSSAIDFTNPEAIEWFVQKIDSLKERYGIAGVKMDGGDARIYKDGLIAFDKVQGSTANGLAECYCRVASLFDISEIRSTSKCAGLPVMQRIADRYHTWEDSKNGFDGIVKKALIMSFMGYPYNCPDMIGGGQCEDIENGVKEDAELNIRYMEAATFMPSFQFSKEIYKFDEMTKNVVLKMIDIRNKYSSYIVECMEYCAKTGTPIIRPLIFEFNVSPFNMEEFMVGDKILVSPVIRKGQNEKEIYLPKGKWMYEPDGTMFDGEKTIKVNSPLDVLPYFVRV